jgi:hypothetical protein
MNIRLKANGIHLVVTRDSLIGAPHGRFTTVLDCAGVQARVLAEDMACGLVAGQIWDGRVVLTGVSMHRGVLSRHSMRELSLHACPIGGLFIISSRRS